MPRYDDDHDLDIRRSRRRRRRRFRDEGLRPPSALGIASVFVAIFCGVSILGLILITGMVSIGQNGQIDDGHPAMIAINLGFLAVSGFTMIGFALGLAGCFQRNRNPLCGFLGSIFNGLMLLGLGGLLCLDVLAGG